MAAGRDRGGLGDDQARAGALGVVFRHQVRRDVGPLGATTSQRSHQDAVRQRQGADLQRSEEGGHGEEEKRRERGRDRGGGRGGGRGRTGVAGDAFRGKKGKKGEGSR